MAWATPAVWSARTGTPMRKNQRTHACGISLSKRLTIAARIAVRLAVSARPPQGRRQQQVLGERQQEQVNRGSVAHVAWSGLCLRPEIVEDDPACARRNTATSAMDRIRAQLINTKRLVGGHGVVGAEATVPVPGRQQSGWNTLHLPPPSTSSGATSVTGRVGRGSWRRQACLSGV